MARILITGSTDGLGLLAARLLVDEGNSVTLHARNGERAKDARAQLPEAEAVVVGDLASIEEVRGVAEQVNVLGRYDAVIHNAAVGYQEPRRIETVDGLSHVFAINVLAPYLLTALVTRPNRLVYLSSGMQHAARADLTDLQWMDRPWRGAQAYADSKLLDTVLAFAVARRWPDVLSNSVDPDWVPTKMGGPAAPGDLRLGPRTQAWLAISDDPEALVSGCHFFHQGQSRAHPAADDYAVQDELLARCAALTGTALF